MTYPTLLIKTENLELPANAARFIHHEPCVTIDVAAVCLGQARNLASDFSLALEYGAGPELQSRVIQAVQDAEDKNIPLHCMLSFGV